jgi:hypothetical protein
MSGTREHEHFAVTIEPPFGMQVMLTSLLAERLHEFRSPAAILVHSLPRSILKVRQNEPVMKFLFVLFLLTLCRWQICRKYFGLE